MRAVLAIVMLLAVLWSGYWVAGSQALSRGAEAWFAAAPAQGIEASRDSLAVRGFPNRFDLTVQDVRLADPASGYAWQAPFAQVFSLSYKPWHIIAALPPSQTLTTPAGVIALTSGKLQASVIVIPGSALTLDRTTLIGTALAATGPGFAIRADDLRLGTRIDPARADTHQIGLEVTNLSPGVVLPDLPAAIGRLRVDAAATLTAPLDRFAGQTRPTLAALDLTEARLDWGTLSLSASGTLVADATGLAEGRITLRVDNWRLLIPVFVASGMIAPDFAPNLTRGLEVMASASPDRDVLDLPVTFARGRVSLGPFPLGPAPRMN